MNSPINVGIIGTGNHGSRYAHHIIHDLSDKFKLAGISRKSSLRGKDQANKLNTTYFSDYSDLIADKNVHAIISVTPPFLNRSIAQACLSHNKKLLLEKPLSTDINDAHFIVRSFKESGLELTIGQTLRYNPIIQCLKDTFHRVGTPYAFSATHRLEPSSISWLEDPVQAGAGVIFHTAVHVFDALRFITGCEITKVHASSFKVHNPNLEDLFTAQIEMENGMIGIVESSKVTPARSGRYEFTGKNGQLQGDQIHGFVEFIEGTNVNTITSEAAGPTILPLLEDWFSFLSGKSSNPISGKDGLAAVKICNACRESAHTGKWVGIP